MSEHAQHIQDAVKDWLATTVRSTFYQNSRIIPDGPLRQGWLNVADFILARERAAAEKELETLSRITAAAEQLSAEHEDPGTEALAAIWCARDRCAELRRALAQPTQEGGVEE